MARPTGRPPGRKPPREELSDAEHRKAVEMRMAGHSLDSIARHFGASREWIGARIVPGWADRRRERQQRPDYLAQRQERDRRHRQQQHAENLARHRARMQEAEELERFTAVASVAEVRRLRAKGMKRTAIAGYLGMRHAEVDAALAGVAR